MASTKKAYSAKHERYNVITHGFGFVLFLCLSPFLLMKANSFSSLLGAAIFCVSLLCVYATSTAYHHAKQESLKSLFRKLDHIAIYLLIGGSYTAFILQYYNETGGYTFMMVHWGIIVLGIIFKMFYTGKFELFSTLLYLVLGWMVVFIYDDITRDMSTFALSTVAVGGIFYTVGVIFYVVEKIPYNHAIWHLFVLGGSISHYISIFSYA